MTDHDTINALHTGLFIGSLFVMLVTALGAYLGYPSVWVTPLSGFALWIFAGIFGDERARGPP